MIKDVLVCLEGSPGSARATEAAIALARTMGAALTGLCVIDEPDIVAGQATGIGGAAYKRERDEALLADAGAHADAWLQAFTARCHDADVPAKRLRLRGLPGDTIAEEMQRHDLTVLGREVNFRFETEDRDKKTRDTVLRRAGKPLLVVPERELSGRTAVVIAYDGSPAAKRALQSFAREGLARDRAVHVVSIGDDGAVAWETAQRGCVLLSELGVPARPHKVVSLRSVADALLEQCEKVEAGILAMGAYVPSRLGRALWGSVTQEIVEKSPLPLFLHY
jgi:nucleotide-binding universal stress UspA family protein